MEMISRILKILIGLLLAALVAVVTLGVVYRYFLQSSLYWGTEVPNIILVWLVFLGSVAAYHQHSHIAFTVVSEMLPGWLGRWNDVIVLMVTLLFFSIMLWQGALMTQQSMTSFTEALRIPKAWVYGAIPVSSALIVLMVLARLGPALKAAVRRDA